MKVDLTEKELFLIEMAVDQTMYCISDINSPLYKTFELIDQKISGLRIISEHAEPHSVVSEPDLANLDAAVKELSNLIQRSDISDKQNVAIRLGIAAITACEDNKIPVSALGIPLDDAVPKF